MGIDLSIAINGETEPRHFADVKEIENWITEEQQFWSWLESLPAVPGNLWHQPRKAWSRIREYIGQYSNLPEDEQQKKLQEIRSALTSLYHENKAMLSTSSKARFVKELSCKNPEEATGCRLHIPNGPGVYNYPSRNDDSNRYVLYVGVTGSDLRKEANQTYKRFIDHWEIEVLGIAFAAVKTEHQAHTLEYYLIRYYCHPWNTRFVKQKRNHIDT